MNKREHKNIYITYDTELKKFLESNNCYDVIYGLHPKTHNMFWVYERSELLNGLLDEWFKK